MSSTLVEMLPRNSRASEIGVHRFLPTRQGDQYGTTRLVPGILGVAEPITVPTW
jgi:hypothetical protein